MRNLQRDPFARETQIRMSVHVMFRTCKWCGSKGRLLKNGLHRLYKYGVIRDDRNDEQLSEGLFCCKSCYEAYKG